MILNVIWATEAADAAHATMDLKDYKIEDQGEHRMQKQKNRVHE